jgi:hypothetical protein
VHSDHVQEEGDVCGTTVREGTFKNANGLREITLEEEQDAKLLLCKDRAGEVPSRLGNPRGFLAAGHPLGKFPEFSEGVD